MKYRPRQPKALWYRAKYGDNPPAKPRYRIRPRSKRRAKLDGQYNRRATEWKEGRLCACIGLRDGEGRLLCGQASHLCEDVHHTRGRAGTLLLDERFWLPVCRGAHRFIQENPAEARRLGLLCGVGQWNTPVKEAA